MSSNRTWTIVVIAVVAIASLVQTNPAEAQQRRASAQVGANCVVGFQALFDEIEVEPLTTQEENDLLQIRRQEKLAHDVYLELADTWELPIFRNIAKAEQRHIELLLTFFEVYSITDTEADYEPGFFSEPQFEALYSTLINVNAPDKNLLVDDLKVGAEIEDVNLAALDALLEFTNNAHVNLIVHNLAKGSRNHLRSFARALDRQDGIYDRLYFDSDLYLDPDDFEAILEADMERRMYSTADGEPVPACGAAVGGFGMRRGPGQHHGGGNGDGSGSNGNGAGNGNGSGTGGSN